MEKIVLKTDLSCKNCVLKVEPILKNEPRIIDYSINLEHTDKLLTITGASTNIHSLIRKLKEKGYSAQIV